MSAPNAEAVAVLLLLSCGFQVYHECTPHLAWLCAVAQQVLCMHDDGTFFATALVLFTCRRKQRVSGILKSTSIDGVRLPAAQFGLPSYHQCSNVTSQRGQGALPTSLTEQ